MLSSPIIARKLISGLSCRCLSVKLIGALAQAEVPGPLSEDDFVFPKARAAKAHAALHWAPPAGLPEVVASLSLDRIV
jgi:hypothetical protein